MNGTEPSSQSNTEVLAVTNRVFLLGLDELYRNSMQRLESGRLLDCARALARRLRVRAAGGSVEGYYVESPELAQYFQLIRELGTLLSRVQGLPLCRAVRADRRGSTVTGGSALSLGNPMRSSCRIRGR